MNNFPENATVQSRQENIWLNLLCNAVIPGFLLSYLSSDQRLGPVWGLVVSLSVPIGYGVWDLWVWHRWNVISIIGIVGTLLTGVLGLLKMDGFWIAVKEASVATVLGLAIPLTLRTRQPLVRVILYNDSLLDTQRIHRALAERQNVEAFEKLLVWASWMLAGSLVSSGFLNFLLARWLLTAAPGTPLFNDQLGKMNWLSWPVITLPCLAVMLYALVKLLKGVERLTGLNGQELFRHPQHKRPGKLASQPGAEPQQRLDSCSEP